MIHPERLVAYTHDFDVEDALDKRYDLLRVAGPTTTFLLIEEIEQLEAIRSVIPRGRPSLYT
jgi:hypothetical protein